MIARKVILAFGINLVKFGFGYVGLFFVARYMGPSALGAIGFGFAYVGIFSFIADLGFGLAHIKRVSEGRDLGKCIGTYLLLKSGLIVAMAISVLVSVYVFRSVLGREFERPENEYIIYVALLTVILGHLSGIASHTFAGKKETAKQNLPELFGKVLEVCLKIVVAIGGFGLIMLAGASAVGTALCLFMAAFLFSGHPIGRPDKGVLKDYWVFALPVMIIVSSNTVTENLDKIMVQLFWSSKELGYYVGAQRISMIFTFLLVSVGMLVFPSISSYHSKNDIHSISRLTHNSERYLSLLLLPVGVLLIFFGSEIAVILLGQAFYHSGNILCFLSWAVIIRTISNPYSLQIMGTDKVKWSAILSVVFMVLNVSLNLLLIPNRIFGIRLFGLGAYGAALATLIAAFVMNLIYRYLAYKLTATGINWAVFRHLVASGIMALVIYGLLSLIEIESIGILIVVSLGLVGFGVYIVFLFLTRELSRDDLTYLLGLVSIRDMKSYIQEELRFNTKIGGVSRDERSS
jgi:O-antigen/teichoic acid export membrane protein